METFAQIPEDLDKNLFGSGRSAQVSLPPGVSYKFMHSHVLLAACRQQQRARECISAAGEPCGFFTNSLITLLRRIKPNRITYADLLDLLPTLPDQNPQCEGANQHRYMFEIDGPSRDVRNFTLAVKEDEADGTRTRTLKVDAESLHGVVVGTQFAVGASSRPDRVLVAESVDLDSSALIPIVPTKDDGGTFPDGARLVVSDWKNDAAMMKVYVHTSDSPPLAASDLSTLGLRRSFLVADSLEDADLAVRRASEHEYSLTRLDATIPRYAAAEVHLGPIHELPCALDAIAHFNYFLGKHNGREPFVDEVRLEMYQLRGDFGARVPNEEVGNLVVNNEVRFQLDTQGKYGFAICNSSKYDLFPYLFYFDPATYSIDVRHSLLSCLQALKWDVMADYVI